MPQPDPNAAGRLTVVMYHYVRDLRRSRAPRLKALDLPRFRAQLDWIAEHHHVVRMEQVIAALDGVEPLPPRALLLTFDDGYADHYAYAVPLLDERGWQGSFYPVASAVDERRVLAPNKVHLILAAHDDPAPVVARMGAWLDAHRAAYGLEPTDAYVAAHAQATRFDTAEVRYVKRMLQHALPEPARSALLDHLFEAAAGVPEATVAEELYASADQLRLMHRHGMHLGAHGVTHGWLTRLAPEAQAAELDGSLDLLRRLGVDTAGWTLAYPYGDVDDAVADLAAARGCAAAFDIVPEVAHLARTDRLRVPRLDTNDLPPHG